MKVLKRYPFFAVILLSLASAASAQSNLPWRYNLHAGDHLVYRYTFERDVPGGETQTKTRAAYTTHVLIVGEQSGRLSVGFQRNRQSAELLLYNEKGKDKLAQQQPGFQRRMAERPTRFAEANEFT